VALLLLGPFVAFVGTGYFSGLGALVAELYPTTIRATAAGFCYNFGRIAAALGTVFWPALGAAVLALACMLAIKELPLADRRR
jgi:hypothetical protein